MSYSTVAKVQAMLKGASITSSTNPNLTDLAVFIAEEEAEINSRLSEIYSVPIIEAGSPLAFAIVSKISTLKISARVKSIIQVQGESEDKVRSPAYAWAKEADEMLKNCLPTYSDSNGKTVRVRAVMPLPDATINKGQPGIGNAVSTSSALGVGRTSRDTFQRNRDNW